MWTGGLENFPFFNLKTVGISPCAILSLCHFHFNIDFIVHYLSISFKWCSIHFIIFCKTVLCLFQCLTFILDWTLFISLKSCSHLYLCTSEHVFILVDATFCFIWYIHLGYLFKQVNTEEAVQCECFICDKPFNVLCFYFSQTLRDTISNTI